jgi:glutamine amidotransferase
VLYQSGVEHGVQTPGLGLLVGRVEPLVAPVIPHMGWNTVIAPSDSAMFAGISDQRFYFVHSYAALAVGDGFGVTLAEYGTRFVAAVENGSLWATQFHPEKSSDAGHRLLQNWLAQL